LEESEEMEFLVSSKGSCINSFYSVNMLNLGNIQLVESVLKICFDAFDLEYKAPKINSKREY
jgi:hypothetical protein